jgi:hypothetical protein
MNRIEIRITSIQIPVSSNAFRHERGRVQELTAATAKERRSRFTHAGSHVFSCANAQDNSWCGAPR